MRVGKIARPRRGEQQNKFVVEYYYQYQGRPMVRIGGNFMGGGFNVSQNKCRAILDNLDEIKRFVNGDYNEKIKELSDDEVLFVDE